MASVGDTQMQKQLRACRRRQRRYIRFKRGPKSSNQRSSFILKNFNAESGEVYIVESIRDEKIIKGQKYYKVRWRGFPPEADSWEPERNLTSVLNIISEFHSSKSKISKSLDMQKNYKAANSPASVPTPPATPNLLLQNLPNRLRGSSEERQLDNSAKRKHCAKSRTSGRYEYVPKHQLVASKTKYFDDIRDGKIDLCSNDLYSRVKTRRRCAAESASTSVSNESTQSQNGSLHGETELECDASMEHFPACSPKCEPVSPSSSCFGTSECFREFNCAFQSNEQMRSEFDVENPKHYDLDVTENVITSNASSSHVSDVISKFDSKAVQSEFNPNSSSKSVYCNFCRCSRLPKVDAGSSPIPHVSLILSFFIVFPNENVV
uniref:SJCHGC05321 protein n=1 Tax=Schistosoma japonicum TaxID=6182 RepID=Q5DBZ5_SCHJA|nr:SJCHGC05321 protein [Schistosoma japonicum]